ncbi:ROK family protein [Sulfurimonas sp.]|jgi:glucokinase|uniref:ROK family protein n=1 Tax=Sulfurimonas sp. TaxID=2022749 RepID=UPI0025D0D4A3|nr:ROK family protein [Sulfurimonas sp.]MCK9472787.1 ROK family protein [Sulfurimonas sp.]MDD3505143.1 ROK family protein [Sulfurimonas sp.]
MNLYIDYGGTNFRYSFDEGKLFNIKSDDVELIAFLETQINLQKDIRKIFISFAGQVKNGKIVSAPNIKIQNFDLKQYFYDNYNIEIILKNDINCAAIYEHSRHKDADVLALLYIGTGFGSAFVIGGEILSGKDNIAGEIGHIPFRKKNFMCGCGRSDCLELSVSGKVFKDGTFNDASEDVKKEFLDGLAFAFHTVLNLFDPDVFILGGGVVKNNPSLLNFLKEEYNNSSFRAIRGDLKISISDIEDANIEGLKILSKG